MKVLIVEDEKGIAESIQAYLAEHGIACEWSSGIVDASDRTTVYDYDCILLDLMLPDGEGMTLLRELKACGKEDCVIILSARENLHSKLEGLQAGADDYLTKPFHLPELLARILAVVRRKQFNGNNAIRFNEIRVDLQARELWVLDRPVVLTRKEFDLLLYLLGNARRVLSRNAIAEHLSGDMADNMVNSDFVYTHVKNLKKKLTQAGAADYLRTVYGLGYKWSE